MKILCVKGPQGSGKDTFAEIVCENFSAVRVSIADHIREFVWSKFSRKIRDKKYLWGTYDQKETPICKSWTLSKTAQKYFDLPAGTPWTGRLLLQFEGTVSGTDIDELVWNIKVSEHLVGVSDLDYVVVTDSRRPEQFELFKSMGDCVVVSLERSIDGKGEDNHETEKLSREYPADVSIDNNGTLEEFKSNVLELITAL
jgi:adenylate kinase family enzyme